MIKHCLEVIEKYKLVFIEDIVSYSTFSKPTFYKKGLNEVNAIKEALDKNKIEIKNGLRAKWYKGDNPTAQIALYKLISTEDEADRLNGSRQKIEHSGEITTKTTGPIPILITTTEQQEKLNEHIKKDTDTPDA